MKLGNPWTFGILFFAAFCYFAWNNFELPTVFLSETSKTMGIVVESKKVPRLPHRMGQLITFAYKVGDSTYIGEHKVNHAKYSYRPIGSKLQIQYTVNNPSNFKFLNYYQFHDYSWPARYFWQENFREYEELYMENGIVKLEHKNKGGKLTSSFLGQYHTHRDTTLVVPLFKPFTPSNTAMCLIRSNSYQKIILRDTISKKTYWRVIKN